MTMMMMMKMMIIRISCVTAMLQFRLDYHKSIYKNYVDKDGMFQSLREK